MKWNISINQRQAIELGLKNINEAILLGMICDCHSWAEPLILEESVYYWTARQKFVRQLPLLDLKDDTIYRYLKNLDRIGLIKYKKLGKKDCVCLTPLGKTYCIDKKTESPISEKNSKKSGKKSEFSISEYNPTNSSLGNATITDSSFLLPLSQSEDKGDQSGSVEVILLDLYSALPPEGIDGLDRFTIVQGIKSIAEEFASDNQRYCKTLVREVLSGGGKTIRNIRRRLQPSVPRFSNRRTGSNRFPTLPHGVNVFDLYETLDFRTGLGKWSENCDLASDVLKMVDEDVF